MFFCSEPQVETCSPREDDAIFTRIHDNDLFLLGSIILPRRQKEETTRTSSSYKHQATTMLLPQAGTPLSIFQFAGLSSEQQKQWLEASCSACDMKPRTTTSSHQRSATNSKKMLGLPALCGDDASSYQEPSLKTDEETEDTDDSVTSLSSRSGVDQESSSQSGTVGVQKRSIFAPYWAKTKEKLQQDHFPIVDKEHTPKMVDILQQASQRSMIPPPLSLPLLHDPSSDDEHDGGPQASCGQGKNIFALPRLQSPDTTASFVQQPLPHLTPQRRAVSTSAISILKKGGDGQQGQQDQQRRRRSSSFSVSFDSRVNVVLVFQDKPPYETTRTRIPPWWARFLTSSTAGTREHGGDA